MAVVSCLADIAASVKMEDAPWKAFLVLLGDPVDHEELAGIPKDMFIKYVTDFEFQIDENVTKLTPVQVGRMSKCFDAINDKLTSAPPRGRPRATNGGGEDRSPGDSGQTSAHHE
jgi:hypothetical protein